MNKSIVNINLFINIKGTENGRFQHFRVGVAHSYNNFRLRNQKDECNQGYLLCGQIKQ